MRELNTNEFAEVSGGNWFEDIYDAAHEAGRRAGAAVREGVISVVDAMSSGGTATTPEEAGFDNSGCHNQCPW